MLRILEKTAQFKKIAVYYLRSDSDDIDGRKGLLTPTIDGEYEDIIEDGKYYKDGKYPENLVERVRDQIE